jgi:signal transduction histidine kinase
MTGAIAGARQWLSRPDGVESWSTPLQRRLGLIWVAFTVPLTAAIGLFVHTRTGYALLLYGLAFGAYVRPAFYVMWQAQRHAPPGHRPAYQVMYASLLMTAGGGVSMVIWAVTGSALIEAIAVPYGAVAAGCHVCGLVMIVRRCSGARALSVDLIESLAVVTAVMAPLVVLWLPAVMGSESRSFTLVSVEVLVATLICTYWVAAQLARQGLRGPVLGASSIAAAGLGAVAAALNVAYMASDYTLWTPVVIAPTALAASGYLLIPLYALNTMPEGLNRLAPQAQVRGGWLPIVVPLVGLVALVGATAAVAGERPWVVPFAFGVVLLLALLAAVRQIAALGETRRLYRQVEASAGDRHRLLAQLLARSVDDRRNVASHLHEQAVAAYVSFTSFAVAADHPRPGIVGASARLGDDLKQRAEALRELTQSLRPLDRERRPGAGLVAAVQAYLDTIYHDAPAPALTVAIPDDLDLDWVAESVLLQIVQEALLNVHKHSDASSVAITLTAAGPTIELRITDDGHGFDPAVTHAAAGIATMQTAATAIDGGVTVQSQPGAGTTVVARFGAATPEPDAPPHLRLVPPLP